MSCTIRTSMYTKYDSVFYFVTRFLYTRIIQSIHYHQSILIMFLMQSVTLWPISTIFLGGVNLGSACVMVAWYPE